MLIKKNEEKAREFAEKYKDYMYEKKLMAREYEKSFYNFILSSDDTQDFNGDLIKMRKESGMIDEKYKELTEKISKSLQLYTQDMLYLMYSTTDNKYLKELIMNQIRINNAVIRDYNTISLKSGRIFEELQALSKEELTKLLELRESEKGIISEEVEILPLNPSIKNYVTKLLNGETLEEDKKEFCIAHSLETEEDFEFHKKAIINEHELEEAQALQMLINDTFDTEDTQVIDKAQENLESTTFIIPGKK